MNFRAIIQHKNIGRAHSWLRIPVGERNAHHPPPPCPPPRQNPPSKHYPPSPTSLRAQRPVNTWCNRELVGSRAQPLDKRKTKPSSKQGCTVTHISLVTWNVTWRQQHPMPKAIASMWIMGTAGVVAWGSSPLLGDAARPSNSGVFSSRYSGIWMFTCFYQRISFHRGGIAIFREIAMDHDNIDAKILLRFSVQGEFGKWSNFSSGIRNYRSSFGWFGGGHVHPWFTTHQKNNPPTPHTLCVNHGYGERYLYAGDKTQEKKLSNLKQIGQQLTAKHTWGLYPFWSRSL